MRIALIVAAATTACGASTPKPDTERESRVAVPLESSVRSGRYAITGRTVTDHCEESLMLAAKEISIDVEAGTLRADVVQRNYELDVRSGELIATGRFDLLEGCGTHQYLEVWRLRPQGPETLEGQLTTYYRDSPSRDCARACKLVTAIDAERITEKPPRTPAK